MSRIKQLLRKCTRIVERLYKDKVILYGNCHMHSIAICLNHSPNFRKKYYIEKIPLFYEGGSVLDKKILSKCKLFIYQDIRETNSFGKEYSSNELIKKLSKECKKVCIPNLYELGYGFFPQCLVQKEQPKYYNKYNPPFKGDNRGLFVHGDSVISEKMEQEYSVEGIIEFANSKEAVSKEKIHEVFERYRKKIKERENRWDIKIYSYIFENYKKIQMFNDFGHPSNAVMKKISEGILELLSIENDLKDFKMIFELEEYEDPIYPCVKETLGLEYSKKYIREQSDKKLVEHMDFDEYIKEYYYWCQKGD